MWQMNVSSPGVDKFGNTIDFYLFPTRNAKAAKRFSDKVLNGAEGLGKANHHQHRQGPDLRHCDCGTEGRRQMPRSAYASAGQISEQCHQSRTRQA